MKIHTTEALMKAEISRRSLMKNLRTWQSCAGKQCFHSAIFPNGPGGRGSGRRESGLEFLHR